MRGGKNTKPLGYTIVEVMVVLAVSGMMFVIAAIFIQGKQEKTSFTAGTGQFASQIQNMVEQVTDGKYSDVPIQCAFNGTSTTVTPSINSYQGSSNALGLNQCVFLGKAINIQEGASSFSIHTIAGGRADTITGKPIVNLAGAHPADVTFLTISQEVPQSLKIYQLKVNGSIQFAPGSSGSYSLGFIQSQGSLGIGNDLNSGAQNIYLYGANHPNLFGAAIRLTNADICVTDGTQYADVLIGDSTNGSNALSVSVQRNGTTTCT